MTKRSLLLAALVLLGTIFAILPKPVEQTDHADHEQGSNAIVREKPKIFTTPYGREIVLFTGVRWRVSRHFPAGYLTIYHRADEQGEFVQFSPSTDWPKHSYPLFVTEGDEGDLWLAIYDVMNNSPSGRRVGVVKDEVEVYRFTKNTQREEIEGIASSLVLGGIDTQLYGSLANKILHLCGSNRCYSINSSGLLNEWPVSQLADYEFVELVFHRHYAAALLRLRHDDRAHGEIDENFSKYFLAQFGPTGLSSLLPIKAKGIPFALRFSTTGLKYQLAVKADELRQLFYFDFNRLGLDGRLEYGSNNLEGRVAWSQVYYLNGLISLWNDGLAWLRPDNESALHDRLNSELSLLTELCQTDYPGLYVKRYSLDRKPLLFALHLGRILQTLQRAISLGVTVDAAVCIQRLKHQLVSLENTVEEPYVAINDRNERRNYIRYKKGYPFWADGVNVPYNFVSGIVGGLLTIEDQVEYSADLMQLILDNEFSVNPPQLWRYWSGDGGRGWNEAAGLSCNTPSYKGNGGGKAHITYRTMDAMSLILLKSSSNSKTDKVHKDLIRHFKDLTEKGWLLPSMNEVFSRTGDDLVTINYTASKRYARSTSPWELQSQVWAVDALRRYHNRADLKDER